jgi:serine/threonine-protein kinase
MTEPLERLQAALADRYRLERELGAGGMATVYLAEDLKHHRHVALKVLRPELSAVLGAERFLKEIELTANLQHPLPTQQEPAHHHRDAVPRDKEECHV